MATKDDLLAAYSDVLARLGELIEDVPDADWSKPTGCPGWTVQDQFSHVIGLELDLSGRRDPEVDLPPLPHLTDDMGRAMEHSVHARRGATPAALRAEYAEVAAARAAALAGMAEETDPDKLYAGPLGWEVKLPTFLGLRVFDLYAHEQDIRRATGRPGHTDCTAMTASLERSLIGLTRSLGTRVPAAQGRRVLVRSAEPQGAWLLDLTGEKPRLTPGEAAADAELATTAANLLALLCGRLDADLGALTRSGDETLAAAVASADLNVAP